MTPNERRLRIAVAAVGLAMAISAAACCVINYRQSPRQLEGWVAAGIILLPMLWVAPLILMAGPGDGVRSTRWWFWIKRAIWMVLVTTAVMAVAMIGILTGGSKATFEALPSIHLCCGVPAGLFCLPYLIELLIRRVFHEPAGDDTEK